MNKAVFFDRDGIILEMVYNSQQSNIDTILNKSDLSFVYGAVELLKYTKSLGYLNIFISNQPSVALKKISEHKFDELDKYYLNLLHKKGATVDDVYNCLHHPFAKIKGYKKICNCRKPKPGLILKARKEHKIDLARSWVVGDGVNDIIAGDRVGCKTILLANLGESEYLRILESKLDGIRPDFMIKKLTEIKSIIKT